MIRPPAFARVMAGILLASLSVTAHALGGNKSENFDSLANDSPAQGWSAFNGTWAAQNGEYRNNDTGANPTIAFFDDNTWKNNFTYDVKILAEWPNTGNLVGAVFGYVDSSNYIQIMVNMFDEMTIKRFSGGQVVDSATVNTADKGAPLAEDVPFTLRVFANANKITVKVNGKIVFNQLDFGTLPEGKIGLTSRANKGHFDNYVVTDNLATQLFSASFTGAVIGTKNPINGRDPDCTSATGAALNCYLYVSGQDASGYTWPIRIWGADGRFQQITQRTDATPATARNFVDAEIAYLTAAEGRTGNATHALHQILRTYGTEGSPQIPYIFQPPDGVAQGDLYVKFWIKIRGKTATDNTVTTAWRMPWQFKTSTDYRVSLLLDTWNYDDFYYPSCNNPEVHDKHPHWRLQGDSWAAVQDPAHPFIWQRCVTDQATNASHRVPINEWFKLEIFFHRSKTGYGHIWADVNGNNIFNYHAPDGLYGANPNVKEAIDRLMLPQLYLGEGTNSLYPHEQWIDDLEIWDGVPAGVPAHP